MKTRGGWFIPDNLSDLKLLELAFSSIDADLWSTVLSPIYFGWGR